MRRRPGRRVVPGKVNASELKASVLPFLGARRSEVVVPPRAGVDFGAIRLDGRRTLLLTTDPLYLDPTLGWEDAAWFAFHILASDLATSGWPPQYLSVDLNLPLEASMADLRAIMRGLSGEASRIGASVVTGHTGRYERCAYPYVGGATFLAIVPTGGFVTSASARVGDRVLLSKVPALETAVMLARIFPDEVERELGNAGLRAARKGFRELSTLTDCQLAAEVGLRGHGVWAMHDLAEGGLHQALRDLAEASGHGLDVDLSQLPRRDWASSVLEHFRVDPLTGSGTGSLIVTVDPRSAPEVLERWRRRGIEGTDLGEVRSSPGVRDRGRALPPPSPDRFWAAVRRASPRRASPGR